MAASSMARPRAPTASIHGRSSLRPLRSSAATSGSASASRPNAASASTASGRNAALGSSVGLDVGVEPRYQRLQRRDRRLVVAQRQLQETQRGNDPVRQPKCAGPLADLECLARRSPRVGYATGVRRQLCPQAQRQEQRRVAAELPCALHRVLGDQVRLGEDRPARCCQGRHAERRRRARLPRPSPHCDAERACRSVRASSSRPVHVEQQGSLHGWSKDQRREDIRILQFHGAGQVRVIEPVPAHESKNDPHAERQPEQVSLAEPLGVPHRLVGRSQAGRDLVGVELRVCQRDQNLHAQRTIGVCLAQRALQQSCPPR